VRAALGAARTSGPLVAAPPHVGGGSGVPASLRDPLLTRLAATGHDLGLAQLIATIGDDVALDLLSAVTDAAPEDVAEGAARLVAAGVLEPVTGTSATYRFHHQLLADLAYETQLLPVRRQRHAQVATVLRRSPDLSAATSGTALAHHLEHAGLTVEAIEEYLVVTRDIQRRGSHTEAIQLLDHCVELLPDVDAGERDGLELRVLSTRGFSVTATIGYGSPQADADYRRTAELLRHERPDREHDLALIGAFTYFLIHGDLAFAEELNENYRRSPDAHGLVDSAMPVEAGRCLTAFFRGDFATAVTEGAAYLAGLGDPVGQPVPEAYPLPNELVTSITSTVGVTKLFMLDLAGADEAARQVEARIEGLPFPFGAYSRAYATSTFALGWYNARLEERAVAAFAAVREVSDRHGMSAYEILCNLQGAMAEARFGQRQPDTIDRCQLLVEVWKATGLLAFVPCFGSVVSMGRLEDGDIEGSLAATAECLAAADRMGMHYWDSTLLRVRGEARLAGGDEGGGDDIVRAAVLAAEQGCPLFEVQARASLCRLLPDAVAKKELRDLLDTIPEELGLPDLVDARTLCAG
jgi:hypothetical protein